MVIRLPIVVCFLALLAGSAPGAEEVLDGVAAVVNKDVITFSQVRELVASREQAMRESLRGAELQKKVTELRLTAINDLIDRQLVLQEFDKNKFQIPEFVIDDHIATIMREQFNGDRQAFIRTLQAQGYTLQRFRKLETSKLIVQAMRQKSVKVNPILTPSKLEQYYREHVAEYSTPEQIKNLEDFAKMAGMYSEDSSKSSGGDWGWIDRKTLDKSLSDPAFALKTGEVSKVVALNGSYYILYVEARKKGETKPMSAVRDEASGKVLQAERQAMQEKWIKDLRSKAYIKIF